jgi:rubredoxin
MHLADFDTGQDEIEVRCGKCMKRMPKPRKPYVIFNCDEKGEFGYVGKMMVISLTANAARNADGNHPNLLKFTVVEQKGFPKRKVHPHILDWMGTVPKVLHPKALQKKNPKPKTTLTFPPKTLICPNCGGMKFDFGSSGGGSQNISCRLCGARWNDTPFGMEPI